MGACVVSIYILHDANKKSCLLKQFLENWEDTLGASASLFSHFFELLNAVICSRSVCLLDEIQRNEIPSSYTGEVRKR